MKKILASLSVFIFGEIISQECEAELEKMFEDFQSDPSSFSEEQKKFLVEGVRKVKKNYFNRAYVPVLGWGPFFCEPVMCVVSSYNRELADKYIYWEKAENSIKEVL